ncbi:MAG: TenA family protein [Ancalomicrobiaceae bacterium]|nr:TenA family protein [Ancalomicrobiaceae bacterium]
MPDFFDRLRAARAPDWQAYVGHRFVDALGDGALPIAAFRAYLIQDYLFLIQFARAHALAIVKSRRLADMRAAAKGVAAILERELDLHLAYCRSWGLDPDEVERMPEHRATLAYTRYVMDVGLSGDLLDLHVALAPCIVGYHEIATGLAVRPGALDPANPYAAWIAEYAGEVYGEVAAAARGQLDDLAARLLAPSRFDDVAEIFGTACRLEADFWEMGWQAG